MKDLTRILYDLDQGNISADEAEERVLGLFNVSHRISGLSAEAKNKLFAIWMSKERLEGSKTLDILLALDEEWRRFYEEYRIKEGFSTAALRANEKVLAIVYGG